jgi:hypothetical protein
MNERIHRCLDGELHPTALTAEERRALARYRLAIDGAVRATGDVSLPDLAPAVDRAIRAQRTPTPRVGRATRVMQRLWEPRSLTLRVRPLLAAAAIVVLALAAGLTAREAASVTAAPRQVFVQFRLDAPDARQVRLAGAFTGWQPALTMHQAAPGVWSVVVALHEGVYDYAFVVDGDHWVADPLAPATDDGFGGTNSRVTVIAPESGRTT